MECRVVRRKCVRPAPYSARSGRSLQPSRFLSAATSDRRFPVQSYSWFLLNFSFFLLLAHALCLNRDGNSLRERVENGENVGPSLASSCNSWSLKSAQIAKL